MFGVWPEYPKNNTRIPSVLLAPRCGHCAFASRDFNQWTVDWGRCAMTKVQVTRRRLLPSAAMAASLGVSAGSSTIFCTAHAQSVRKTFVLVHGAFCGSWIWRRVADQLEQRGHKVFVPALTGLGERSHLLRK